MNDQIIQLVPAVVAYVANQGGYVTKTKLLKLLYLIDVDFYRVHHRTLTGFQWKYFHLGPWTNEFDPVLEKLVAEETIIETKSLKTEFETKFYKTTEPKEF